MNYEPVYDRMTDAEVQRYTGGLFPRPHDWDPMLEVCRRCRITRDELDKLPKGEQGCHG